MDNIIRVDTYVPIVAYGIVCCEASILIIDKRPIIIRLYFEKFGCLNFPYSSESETGKIYGRDMGN